MIPTFVSHQISILNEMRWKWTFKSKHWMLYMREKLLQNHSLKHSIRTFRIFQMFCPKVMSKDTWPMNNLFNLCFKMGLFMLFILCCLWIWPDQSHSLIAYLYIHMNLLIGMQLSIWDPPHYLINGDKHFSSICFSSKQQSRQ